MGEILRLVLRLFGERKSEEIFVALLMAGVQNLSDLAEMTAEELTSLCGLDQIQARKLLEEAGLSRTGTMDAVKVLIKELPLSEEKANEVLDVLSVKGVKEFADLKYTKEEDLTGCLSPVDVRKVLQVFEDAGKQESLILKQIALGETNTEAKELEASALRRARKREELPGTSKGIPHEESPQKASRSVDSAEAKNLKQQSRKLLTTIDLKRATISRLANNLKRREEEMARIQEKWDAEKGHFYKTINELKDELDLTIKDLEKVNPLMEKILIGIH